MGTNCNTHPSPNPQNICDNALGDSVYGQHFCTLSGSHNDAREAFCAGMSSAGEWAFTGTGNGSCYYNDCDEHTDFGGSGCCNGCCGIIGSGVTCSREHFYGDPTLCCLRDYACNGAANPTTCFDDSSIQRTCSPSNPDTRDQTSTDCRAVMLNYCATGDSEQLAQRWLGDVIVQGQTFSRPCYRTLYRNLYAGSAASCAATPGVGVPTAEGYAWAQQLIEATMAQYASNGGNLDARPGDSGSDTTLNAMFWGICQGDPGLCAKGLYRYCSDVTTNTISRRVSLLPWCGCYMPDAQYSEYTDLYQVAKECTPTCNLASVIPLTNESGMGKRSCQQSLCIIDDLSLTIAQSQVGLNGGITFSQVCSGCAIAGGTGTCSCILSGTTIAIIESEIPSLNITQECGNGGIGGAACYATTKNANGVITNATRVPCSSQANYNPFAQIQAEDAANKLAATTRHNWLVLAILVAVLVVIMVLWMLLVRPTPGGTIVVSPAISENTSSPFLGDTNRPLKLPISVTSYMPATSSSLFGGYSAMAH